MTNHYGRNTTISDYHRLVVHSRILLVEETLGLECIATVNDGQSGIECALELIPDLIILDLNLPRIRGDEAINTLGQVCADKKILVISALNNSCVLGGVLESGAKGIVLKGSPVNEICEAIPDVLFGKKYICSDVSANFFAKDLVDIKLESLTNRGREVFELQLQRTSVRIISTRLNVSSKTVNNHKTRIMAKLDVHSRADLVAFAVGAGL